MSSNLLASVQGMAEIASSRLTLRQVQNELREVTEWYPLGVQLGIQTSELKQIEANYSKSAERCKLEVFHYWLSNTSDPSWRALLVAVEALGTHARLVRKLQSYCDEDTRSEANEATLTAEPEAEIVTNSKGRGYCNGSGTGDTENLYTKLQDEPPVADCMLTGNDYDESDLQVETDKIMLNFGALVTRVQRALNRCGVTVDELASHLETVKAFQPVYAQSKTPLLVDCIEEVRAQKSMGDAFRCFSDYFSWFNYLLIENIINAFCKDRLSIDIQEGLAEFKHQFQEYCNNRLFKCPGKNEFGLGRKKDASILVIKVDHKWEVARVSQVAYIKDAIARVLKIKKQALYLRTVKNGCIELTFLVPKFVADVISLIKPEEIADSLCSIGVLELFCEDFRLYPIGNGRHSSGAESEGTESAEVTYKLMPRWKPFSATMPEESDDSFMAESEGNNNMKQSSNLDGSTCEHQENSNFEAKLKAQCQKVSEYRSFLWKIPNISRWRRDTIDERITSIYSPPFYTRRPGYKMCIRVCLNGDGIGYKTHLSIFFALMKGEYDRLLKWPLEMEVFLILIDQTEYGRHNIVKTLNKPTQQSISFLQPCSDINVTSEYQQFANLNVLDDEKYVKDDIMYIKCVLIC